MCLKILEKPVVHIMTWIQPHYVSAPGLAWDACLKMTKIELELMSDIDQYLFVEKGLRGGLSVIEKYKQIINI